MPSELDVANMALSRLGQSPLTVFGQNTGTGLILYSHYAQERDALLRTIPWSFARKWISIAQLQNAPISLDINPNSASPGSIIYTTAYALPLDFLRLYRFSPRDAHWRLVGKAIYTDAVPAATTGVLLGLQPLGSDGPDNQPPSASNSLVTTIGIEYIYRVVDPNVWDTLFTETLVWKLTKDLAFGVTAWADLYKVAAAEYKESIANAAAVNGMENWPDEYYNVDLTEVRYGYSGLNFGGL